MRLRSRSREGHAVRDRRQRGTPRLARGLHRRDGGWGCRARARGRGWIGKSTFWLAGVELARSRGLRVLSSRPAEAERGLDHVGLSDLFEDVFADIAAAISTPRRRALEIALLREEAETILSITARSAWPYATRCTFSARERPILLAIDDVQCLDPSSSTALAFALRRLAPSPVLVLLARRLETGTEPSELEQALAAGRVERLPVGSTSLLALGALAPCAARRVHLDATTLSIQARIV